MSPSGRDSSFFTSWVQLAPQANGSPKEQPRQKQRWCEFLQQAGLATEPFLEPFSQQDKHRILGAFAQAVRSNMFGQSTKGKGRPIGKGTVSAHLDHVATALPRTDTPIPTSTTMASLHSFYSGN
jgi:hypothetical protein